MKSHWRLAWLLPLMFLLSPIVAQPPQDPFEKDKGPQPFPGGPPPMGGPMGGKRSVIGQFDKDGNGRLDREERLNAREVLRKNNAGRSFMGKGGFGKGKQEPAKPGPRVDAAKVTHYPDAPLYDPAVLRTLFLQFEHDDWEAELGDFYHTDVEIPATLVVDGKSYPNVGVGFRGASSFFTVGAGHKRSLNISLDAVDQKQKLYGYKTLNLLNAHDDPTFLGSVLYSHIARAYLPTPKANLIKLVINGESWGVYVNEQQFDKQFLVENFKSSKGDRWKVPGNPMSGGGLKYVGDNVDDYKRRYQIKSADNAKSWKALIELCRTLDKTPPEQLEEALRPILNVDGLLWFLAIDNAVINCDGYWIRASDFSMYHDAKGQFHIVPHDFNECFRPAMGPGFGGMGGPGGFRPKDNVPPPADQPKDLIQDIVKFKDDSVDDRPKDKDGAKGDRPKGGDPRGQGVGLDPLIGIKDANRPLRSKLLSVPKFREQYLRNMRTLAEESFDWAKIGPVVAQYRALIEREVEADTRKLYSYDAFLALTSDQAAGPSTRREGAMNLRQFFEQRRKYLLGHDEIKKLPR